MLCYYNVHVFNSRGKFSRFPEHHWVASSMIYAFCPTTFFQLGVYTYHRTIVQSLTRFIGGAIINPRKLSQ